MIGIRNGILRIATVSLLATGAACLAEPDELEPSPEVEAQSFAVETMTDRCSNTVVFPRSYDGRPDSPNAILLERYPDGSTSWTPPFEVETSSSGHIRWFCKSTRGNLFDPGTWRIDSLELGTSCEIYADFTPEKCKTDVDVSFGSSVWNDTWTPERSRCDDRSKRIRARLGPDRLLQIECLGD
jgi:hypothetical protein